MNVICKCTKLNKNFSQETHYTEWKSQEAQNKPVAHFIFLIVVSYFFPPFSLSDWGRVLSKCQGVKLLSFHKIYNYD